MNIDVHPGKGDVQIQHASGVAPGEKAVFVGLLQRRLQKSGFDKTPVAEEILLPPVASAGRGGGYIAGELDPVVFPGA